MENKGVTFNLVSTHYEYNGICNSVKFAQDKKTLVAGYWYDNVRVWNLENQHFQYPLGSDSSQTCFVDMSYGGEFFAINISGNTIKVWNLEESKIPILEITTPERSWWRALALSPKTSFFAAGYKSGMLRLWNISNCTERNIFTPHKREILAMDFSPDEKLLVSTAAGEPMFRLLDVESGYGVSDTIPENYPLDIDMYKGDTDEIQRIQQRLLSKEGKRPLKCIITSIMFSPCGTLIAGKVSEMIQGTPHQEIRLWNVRTYEPYMAVLLPQGYWHHPYAFTFSPCGQYFASDMAKENHENILIGVWNVGTGEKIATFAGHPYGVTSLAFSKDSMLLASAGGDATILLWDMKPYLLNP